ncbi:MAG: tRNA guanosine(15) transglycosylase TgtA [archaeon]
MDFEIKHKDLAARIGILETNHGKIETPTLLPVVNPNLQIIPLQELKKFGTQIFITNSYILLKNFRDEVLSKGIHGFLGWDGPIMTDSGAYQLMEYGELDVSNKDILDFQEKIGVDLGVILDSPTASREKSEVGYNLNKTLERMKELKDFYLSSQSAWCGPIQGIGFPDLLDKSVNFAKKYDFSVYAIGSAVPYLIEYNYAPIFSTIAHVKSKLPLNRPVHLFGAGHPLIFPFLVALGVDMFDSAAYALYAGDGRYMTPTGTMRLEEMFELPCYCPVCSKYTAKEIKESQDKERLLSEHNLYISFQEIKTIKLAIRENTLFDLIETRVRAHPSLFHAMPAFLKALRKLRYLDPISKPHFYYLSEFSKKRIEVLDVKERIKNVESKDTVDLPPFGKVPKTILECYPFQRPNYENNYQKISDISKYWFGLNIFPENVVIVQSPKTKKIKAVYQNSELFTVFRASDMQILLHAGARELFKKTKYPHFRVKIKNEIKDFVLNKKNVFCKFVVDCDKKIRPGQQVLIVDEEGNLLASGEALLSAREILSFEKGVAVVPRWVNLN